MMRRNLLILALAVLTLGLFIQGYVYVANVHARCCPKPPCPCDKPGPPPPPPQGYVSGNWHYHVDASHHGSPSLNALGLNALQQYSTELYPDIMVRFDVESSGGFACWFEFRCNSTPLGNPYYAGYNGQSAWMDVYRPYSYPVNTIYLEASSCGPLDVTITGYWWKCYNHNPYPERNEPVQQ